MGSSTERSITSSTGVRPPGRSVEGRRASLDDLRDAFAVDGASTFAADWVAALALGLAVSAHDDEVAVDEVLGASGRCPQVLSAASARVSLVGTLDEGGSRRAVRLLELARDRVALDDPRPGDAR